MVSPFRFSVSVPFVTNASEETYKYGEEKATFHSLTPEQRIHR